MWLVLVGFVHKIKFIVIRFVVLVPIFIGTLTAVIFNYLTVMYHVTFHSLLPRRTRLGFFGFIYLYTR